MANFLGFTASVGMLSLVGCLFVLFIKQTGAMRPETCRTLLHSFLMAAGIGTAYLLTAALICHLTRTEIAGPAMVDVIFPSKRMTRWFAALQTPVWTGPLSSLFVFVGHFLGLLLFGQYELAGVALAFLLTVISVCLLASRLRAFLGDRMAKETSFLLLCLPGGVFFFLPGWAPVALLLFSVVFSLLGKRIPPADRALHIPAYGLILTLSTVLSAFVLTGAVYGWIG